MKNWIMTRMEVENGQCSPYSAYYNNTTFYNQVSVSRPILRVEFQHKNTRMTKSYNEIPITPAIESALHSMNYEALSTLNDKSLENGFVALEDDNGAINYCNRAISDCNQNCCLHNVCDLGPMRKMSEGGR